MIVYSGACDWDRPTVCAGGEIKQIENLEQKSYFQIIGEK